MSLLKKSIQPIKTTNTKQTSQNSIPETPKALPSPESTKNHTDDNIGEQEVLDKNVADGARYFQKYFGVQNKARAVLLAKISVYVGSDPTKTCALFDGYSNKNLEELLQLHNQYPELSYDELKAKCMK